MFKLTTGINLHAKAISVSRRDVKTNICNASYVIDCIAESFAGSLRIANDDSLQNTLTHNVYIHCGLLKSSEPTAN